MSFEFIPQKLQGSYLIKPKILKDNRGHFLESYKQEEFKNILKTDFIQENISLSIKNTIIGLHFQTQPKAQSKLVRCSKGSIIDVLVDLNPHSKTFLQYDMIKLDDESYNFVFLPSNFAHGFLVLSDVAEVIYKVDNLYSKDNEESIIYNDATLNIPWNITNPIISEKDLKAPTIKESKYLKQYL
jgi:dTDP-4-dehydrorhamnose 3,5-epimerase